MSYLVLARKYRPATFSEVVGQEHVTRTLGNAFATGRVHHAFLFCGPRGCGKTTLARIVGKALNCERGPTAEPCGVCSACTSIGNGSAVDYQEMDGASNRGIDAIRELTEAVRYQPAVLRKKVYVIDEVHMLTTEAFNALLKTLEEPPPHVTFVLATTEPHKLPNTILSRCQRYDFKLVPASRLAQHLASMFKQEKLSVESGAISLVVRESGGSVRDALSLCDQIISYVGDSTITEAHVAEVLGVADRSLTRKLVSALATGDAGSALGAVESAIERGVDEVQLARAIVRYLRDLSVLQVAPDRPELVDASDEERAELVAEAAQLDRSRVMQMFDRMLRCCDELGKTLQPRLVLDCALIDVATIEPIVPLGDLIERLGELESRIAGKGGTRSTASSGGGGGTRASAPASAARPSAAPTVPQRPASRRDENKSMAAEAGPATVARPTNSGAVMVARATDSGAVTAARSTDSGAVMVARAAESGAATAESGAATVARSADSGSATGSRSDDGARPAPADASRSVDGARPAPADASRSVDGARPASGDASRSVDSARPADASRSPSSMSGEASRSASADVSRSASTDRSAPPISDNSGPVSMQPSGPVPKAEKLADGSGPTAEQTLQASAPESTAFGVPGSSNEALKAWASVIDYLEQQRKISLRGYYEFARVMRWTATEVELGFAADDDSRWAGENAAEKANIEELRTVLADLGHKVKVTVRMLDQTESKGTQARSIIESSREKSYAERTKREHEAREHPITKHVLQTFGASIKEIKTDV